MFFFFYSKLSLKLTKQSQGTKKAPPVQRMGPAYCWHYGMLELVFTVMLKDLFGARDDALFLVKKGKQVFSLCAWTACFSGEICSVLWSILYPDEFPSILEYTKDENGQVFCLLFLLL